MVEQQEGEEEDEEDEGVWWPPRLLGCWMHAPVPVLQQGQGEGGPPTRSAEVDLRRVVARLWELAA
jgi:hypothetical protein